MHACAQVDTQWRKAAPRLEGEDAYEALDKLDRLEVYQEYILCALSGGALAGTELRRTVHAAACPSPLAKRPPGAPLLKQN
jgi:hypothetical protein